MKKNLATIIIVIAIFFVFPLNLIQAQKIEAVESSPFVFKTDGLIWATPVIDEKETVYVGSADKYFYAIDNNGDLVWKYKISNVLDSLIDSAAIIADDKIVIPGGDGYIHAVNKNTGDLVWKFKAYHATQEQEKSGELVNSFEGNVAKQQDYFYAGSDNGHMYCIDQNGKEVWNFETGMMIWSSPCFYNDWMAFGSLDGYLYLLNSYTGELLDKIKIGEIKASPAYDPESDLLFVGTSNGTMYALNITDNKFRKLWSFKTTKEIYSSVSYYKKKIYFGSGANFYSLDYDGKLLWKYNTLSNISSSPAVIKDKMIIFGAENGKLYALNFNGERIWSFRTTNSAHKANLDSSPAVSKSGDVYVGSYNGNLYKIPSAYCLENQDERCEFGGTSDPPLNNGKTLRFENAEVGLSEPLKIKMTIFEKENYIENAALSSARMTISPNIDFSYYISSDGKFINIIPKDFWDPDTNYEIKINASYYKKTNFFLDMLKWFFLPKIEEFLTFFTKDAGSSINEPQTFLIRDIFLYQPSAANTLVAAALDGQKYIADFSVKEADEVKITLTPAFESGGIFYKIEDSEREIVLDGKINGKYFIATGNPTLSAMGGTIPLKNAIFSGEIENGFINNGMFFAKTSCFDIKGNSKNYNIPLNMISEICGRNFNLVAIGGYYGISIK